ncbi:MAG: methyltransferase domain-containing protein [Anaerolineales bacterium]|nr:methyltransferase domain-containing protein [Anaerolineales bacterium]
MTDSSPADLRASYDRIADAYARQIYDELRHKPFDRQQLDQLAAIVGSRGLICDLGCGPGQVARYLADRGAAVVGVDLSEGMLAQARRLNPDLTFVQGDLRALTDVPDSAWVGIAAFYSIIHIPRAQVVEALRELQRVLEPGGWLLLAFHIGDEVLHLSTWWERPVSADFVFFQADEMTRYLESAGFSLEYALEREPYPAVEHQSRRAYILARKPG